MKRYSNGHIAQPSGEEPSTSRAQPMATSTPSTNTNRTTMRKVQVSPSPSPSPAIWENAGSSSGKIAMVTPTVKTKDVANSSLPQRVPKTFKQITGRRPVHLDLVNYAKCPSGRPNEKVPMAPKNYIPKPKNARLSSPEDTISVASSTSATAARNKPMFSPPQPPTDPYKVLVLNMPNGPIGLLLLNLDKLKEQTLNGEIPANLGLGDSPQVANPKPVIIGKTKDKGTPPPPETPDNNNNNTDSQPEEEQPNTNKKCLIM
ncbi:rho GTPase-activating protein 17-like [Drosophila serrata]|uniref:rho GTPase-activating protein 17-like n=1 Tax=Drosophila serrata TaxID=7274 RepID=UPI000A1D09DD|nr:rho GTPase-activating protein 17-like [Drosophila serrata]